MLSFTETVFYFNYQRLYIG